jgi:hypothetical protein
MHADSPPAPTSDETSRRAGWRAWKEATFGSEYMIWHDGLSTAGVAALTGPARAKTVAWLRLGVALGDAHAAEALGAMGEVAAVDELRAQLTTATGADRVRVALALHALAPDPLLAPVLIEVLRGTDCGWSSRIDAAMGLRHFCGPGDEAALLEAVAMDPDYLVRNHAAESLLARFRVVPREIAAHRAIFGDLCGPTDGAPGPADFVRFARARDALAALRPAS